MANKIFTTFKVSMGDAGAAYHGGANLDLAVTGAGGAGLAVLISSLAISDAAAESTDYRWYEDMYDTAGRDWRNGGTVPTGGVYDDGGTGDWAVANTIFCEARADANTPSAGDGQTGTFAASGEYAVFDISDNAVFENVQTLASAQIVSVLVVLLGATANSSDSPLVAKFDTGTGLPLNDPALADVTVVFDDGDAKVFRF